MIASKVRGMLAGCAAVFLAAMPRSASAAEVQVVTEPAAPSWAIEAGIAYAVAQSFSGWGLSLRAGPQPRPFFLVGFALESTRLRAEWQDPLGGGTLVQGFRSTLVGGFARVQLGPRLVNPYAELALGYAAIHGKEGFGYACTWNSGVGFAVAAGADLRLIRSMSVGLRAGARLPAMSENCPVDGPSAVDGPDLILSLSATAAYRW